LVFLHLGDHIYNIKSNPYNPIGTLWPCNQSQDIINKIEKDVADLLKNCGFRNGPINVEARVNSEDKNYIMEIGPRSGGHFVPQAIFYATGFDMVKASLDVLLGKKIELSNQTHNCAAYYAIHSDFNGKLLHLDLNEKLKPYIREFHQYIFPGETVKSFESSNAAIGILLLTFKNGKEMELIMSKIQDYIELKIE